MIKTGVIRLVVLFLGLIFSLSAFAKIPTTALEKLEKADSSISDILKKTMPAVVNIITRGDLPIPNDPFLKRKLDQLRQEGVFKDQQFTSIGSGVIIDSAHGLIVTNAHVVNLNKHIMVTLSDGRYFEAKKLGEDDDSDIAVIQIKATGLTEIPFGDSRVLKIGDFVTAIGSPLGLSQTVTSGIISALNRTGLGIEGLEDFIQTDAPINMGNSGGALINLKGQLIGLNTAIASTSPFGGNIGIGFAIPSNMVKSVAEQILKFGKVNRGMMGIMVQTLSPDIAQVFKATNLKGALVSQVLPQSPAEKSGIKIGDIITKINNQAITSNGDVHNILGLLRSGENIKLDILRDGKIVSISTQTSDPKLREEKSKQLLPYLHNIEMQNIEVTLPNHGYVKGVEVLGMDAYSPAKIAGLMLGDIIISANRKETRTIAELMKIVSEVNPNTGTGLLLNIIRGNNALFVMVK